MSPAAPTVRSLPHHGSIEAWTAPRGLERKRKPVQHLQDADCCRINRGSREAIPVAYEPLVEAAPIRQGFENTDAGLRCPAGGSTLFAAADAKAIGRLQTSHWRHSLATLSITQFEYKWTSDSEEDRAPRRLNLRGIRLPPRGFDALREVQFFEMG